MKQTKETEDVLLYWLITYGMTDVAIKGSYYNALPDSMKEYKLSLIGDGLISDERPSHRKLTQKALNYIREEMGYDTSTT